MKYSLILILSLVLLSCSSDPWTDEEKDQFIEACKEEGGKKKYCKCFMEKTMNEYPRYEDTEDMSFEESFELSLECE